MSPFLDGVRVLDLSRILAGPLAAQILGDMGADVLKVEHPQGGDDTRGWGPPFQAEQSAYFQSCNRNKRSLPLDLKTDRDRQRLYELARVADVCIDNFPPSVRQRLGIDASTLRAANPRLITVNVSTFAEHTARSDERGYDLALQAESGWIALNGDPDGVGSKVGVAVLDVLTANMASNGALAALYARERTRVGQAVQVSLYQTALFSLVNVASNHLVSGAPTQRWGNAHPNIVPYQAFACRDRSIVIAVGNDRQFVELHRELGLPAPFAGYDNVARSRERASLVSAIAERVATRSADELLTSLRARHVPCAPILRADEALRRPEATLVAIEHPQVGTIQTVASPIVAAGMRQQHLPPPQLGEHGEHVAAQWLGTSPRSPDSPTDARVSPATAEAPSSNHYHMSPAEFRRRGYAMIDWIADYMQRAEEHPVRSRCHPGEVRTRLPPHPPQHGESFDAIFRDVQDIVLPGITHWQSPNFFAYFPANTSGPSILGELLSAGLGVQGMLWATSPACTELETHVLDWLVEMLGLPAKFLSSGPGGGVIQDTASSAVLCALLAAAERKLAELGAAPPDARATQRRRFVVYTSDQAHSSVQKAVNVAGFQVDQLRLLPTDTAHRLDHAALAEAIRRDLDDNRVPLFVCATLGTTSSQAVDPLPAIAATCAEHGLWFHVDGAMSGTAALCPEFRHLQAGLEHADSYAFNPHKWMFTNFDCNCMYVADRRPLVAALSILPEYLRNAASDAGDVIDYRDWHIPLGRRFRALKLWFVIRHYGVEGLRHHIREHVALAHELADLVRDDPRFELVTEPTLNLVCLRHRDGDERSRSILEQINDSGRAYLSHTLLDGRYIVRVCIGQTYTQRRHVLALWAQLQALA